MLLIPIPIDGRIRSLDNPMPQTGETQSISDEAVLDAAGQEVTAQAAADHL
jgi:hypothetical protein